MPMYFDVLLHDEVMRSNVLQLWTACHERFQLMAALTCSMAMVEQECVVTNAENDSKGI